MPPSNIAGSSSASQAYRNPTVEEDDDEDDDDFDDLDDVLASFNAPKQQAGETTSSSGRRNLPLSSGQTSSMPSNATAAATGSHPGGMEAGADGGDEDDFEASLMQGMESLLRQLAGDHPPGPMAGPGPVPQLVPSSTPQTTSSSIPSHGQISGSGAAGPNGQNGNGMSKEAEEEAWKKAVEMVLSGEGLAALGLNEDGSSHGKGKSASNGNASSSSASPAATSRAAKPSYEETLQRTLDSLNTAGTKPTSSKTNSGQPDLASLLASLGGDPDLLKNLDLGDFGGAGEGDGEGDDGDLADVLEGMMSQLMTKEVLEEPMTELASKYPPYLASPPPGTPAADLDKYKAQYVLVQRILSVFAKPNYSDERDGKEIAGLVSEMQDLGGPPKEVMGDMPEGFVSGLELV
ncbi:hypothetical protein I316_04948 [Kwoniella heveanensis BCC8398]|uniref:Peroxin-19 n=1 Tax=Kwoniella heveanensis BCC8398 TaxID=1296120 RepID=A0A1B9GR76_9TREE|nr:hypothetical protein I316_04948 [Kwoniella heveanensis BCC8398]